MHSLFQRFQNSQTCAPKPPLVPGVPVPAPLFPEGQDDPAQAEELERQQDA